MGIRDWIREQRDRVPKRQQEPPHRRDRKVDAPPRAATTPQRSPLNPSDGLGLRPPANVAAQNRAYQERKARRQQGDGGGRTQQRNERKR